MRRSPRKAVAAGALIAGVAMVAAALPASALPASTLPAPAATGTQAPAASLSPAPRAGALKAALTPAQHAALLADAQAHRATTAHALGLGAQEQLLPKSVLKDADGTLHTRYERTFAGLPVLGGDLVVHSAANGAVKSVTKATRATIAVASTTAVKTADSAKSFALGRANSEGATSPRADSVRKVVWAAADRPTLAWETVVGGVQHDKTPSELHVITDAATGAKLFEYQAVKNGTGNSQYAGQVTLGTSGSAGNYSMIDNTRGGHKTTDLDHAYDDPFGGNIPVGTTFTDPDDVWGTGAPGNAQTAGVDAAYGAQLAWDYYKNVHARNGVRNDGVAPHSRVHYDNIYRNAFWWEACFCMTYGDGYYNANPLTSIDVAAHEMTHAVTGYTAGLIYSNESGGLNEATSDIMATTVEFWAHNSADAGDYLIGEKINIDLDGKPLRYMDRPSKDGASKDSWYSGIGGIDVHWSSGPANHWFYLASEGSGAKTVNGVSYNSPTSDGLPVNPIGRDTAAKIWYRALTTYMTSNTNYAGARTATLQAAADLYGASSPTYKNAANAWAAVNVGPRITQGVTLTNPGDQVSQTGTAVSLQIQAVTSNAGGMTYTATGLPAGLSLNASTGKITGAPTTAGNHTITLTATDSTGALDTVSFSWLTYAIGACTTTQLLGNAGFESGNTAWTTTGNGTVISNDSSWLFPRTGTWKALVGGNGARVSDTLTQTVFVPYGCKATVSFWLRVVTNESTTTTPYDQLTVTANGTTLATYSNLNASTGYVQKTVDLAPVAGQNVTLKFTSTEDTATPTYFLLDDTALTVHN
ncbi:peptidase M4 [Streptomyces viridochromogenes]|uniref:Peptidase M4 n=2 Tax=Streptomyces TaxID=1883 RepID=A0A0L8LDG6_STRVR|nr:MULTISPECIES: M4 family metallopeptidase [Streptomyces]KOG36167.1 peptidase M4 [Streptomyces viridochromogenes]